jgi:putative tryptophan/tyrosine transport system substrate-binding protein
MDRPVPSGATSACGKLAAAGSEGEPMPDVRRREVIALLGGAAVAWPISARAQQPAMPVIGYLANASPVGFAQFVTAFRRGLSETGYVEGRSVAIEYRWAEGHTDRLPALAADLVRRQVAVIAAAGASSSLAAKVATTTIPIVFSAAIDPVAAGLVVSLSRPAGNVTGVTNLGVELLQKQVEMLHEVVPMATTVAGLVNPTFPGSEAEARDLQAAARKLGLELHVVYASSERDLDTAFETMVRLGATALVIGVDPFFLSHRDQIAALAIRYAMPAIFCFREFSAAGGLMSYGPSLTDAYRQVGIYAGRILKGEKPADLPVVQPSKFELVINLKTAKALDLDMPWFLQQRADEVIE